VHWFSGNYSDTCWGEEFLEFYLIWISVSPPPPPKITKFTNVFVVKSELGCSWTQLVDCVWNVMAHAQKPDLVFRRNELHLNRRGRQFSRLLAAEVCASAVVMLVTPCSEVVWRVLATHSIRQFPLHFPCRASPCAIRFQPESTIERAIAGVSCGQFATVSLKFKVATYSQETFGDR
jgi:hypothetical protein